MDMYTDIERSIQQALLVAVVPIDGLIIKIFNNQVSKSDYSDAHGAISISRITDVYQPGNGGGTGAYIRDAVKDANGAVTGFNQQQWPDAFDLMYALTISAETVKNVAVAGGIAVAGLDIVRACDAMIRTVFKPRTPLRLWNSAANSGNGDWSSNYVDYTYAGYINRDQPQDELYNRVTNIRFEVFNYDLVPKPVPSIRTVQMNGSIITV